MKTKQKNPTTKQSRQQAAPPPRGGRFLPHTPPCGSKATCQEPLASAEKNTVSLPKSVDAHTLASLVGVSTRRLGQLVDNGILVRDGRGSFPFPESVSAFCQYQRHHNTSDEDRRYRLARAKLTEAKERKAQLELDLLNGKALRIDIAGPLFCDFIANARSRLLALPTRCAPMVADLSKPAECFEVLRDAVHEALEELSNATAETTRESIERHRAEANMGPLPTEQEQPQREDL